MHCRSNHFISTYAINDCANEATICCNSFQIAFGFVSHCTHRLKPCWVLSVCFSSSSVFPLSVGFLGLPHFLLLAQGGVDWGNGAVIAAECTGCAAPTAGPTHSRDYSYYQPFSQWGTEWPNEIFKWMRGIKLSITELNFQNVCGAYLWVRVCALEKLIKSAQWLSAL